MSRRLAMSVFVTVLCLSSSAAIASEIGQEIADQVSVASYRHFIDDLLYTRLGHNRGMTGPEHDPARDNIEATFLSFGLDVELHPFWYYETEYNVVATQLGSVYPDAQYIVGGHYDSVGNPGADDDASGIAALLEIARVISQYETEYTVKFIAFDAEERGLIGSRAYVNDHLNDDIRGMVQLDMIAWDSGQYTSDIYGRTTSSPIKNAVAAAINEYGNNLTVTIRGRNDGSDHAPFEWAGFLACALSEGAHSGNPCYHRTCDSVDTPNYISYDFATDIARSVAGFLADNAVALELCPGDVDGDGDTDPEDLNLLLAAWFSKPGDPNWDPRADLDGDNIVGPQDLTILLADWMCGA